MNNIISDFRLEFRDIEYVSAIVQYQGFSHAAEQLHITQPALSIYIKSLEKRLGIPVFNRLGKKCILTYAGECLLDSGKHLLSIRNDIERQLSDIKHQESGVIRIGFTPTRGISFLPLMLSCFNEKYPNIEIIGIEQPAQTLEKMVMDGTLDIVFFNRVSDNDKLIFQEVTSDPVVLFLSETLAKSLPIKKRPGFPHPWLDLSELSSYSFIRNSPEQNTEKITIQIFEEYKMAPKTALQISSQFTAINLAAYGHGIYLAPEYFVYNISLKKRPVLLSFGATPTQYNLSFVAATAKDSYHSIPINDFITMASSLYTYESFPPSSYRK